MAEDQKVAVPNDVAEHLGSARELLGTRALEERGPGLLLRATSGFVVLVLVFEAGAVIAMALR